MQPKSHTQPSTLQVAALPRTHLSAICCFPAARQGGEQPDLGLQSPSCSSPNVTDMDPRPSLDLAKCPLSDKRGRVP